LPSSSTCLATSAACFAASAGSGESAGADFFGSGVFLGGMPPSDLSWSPTALSATGRERAGDSKTFAGGGGLAASVRFSSCARALPAQASVPAVRRIIRRILAPPYDHSPSASGVCPIYLSDVEQPALDASVEKTPGAEESPASPTKAPA